MQYTLAMDDQLLKLFSDFKRGQLGETSTLLIQNLLRLYQPPHITSTDQLRAAGVEDPALMQQLASMGLTQETAEELVKRTRYKVLLSAEQMEYPAVKVSGDSVSSQFVMTLNPGEDRVKAHEWMRALLSEARTVTVVDRYLCDEQSKQLKPNARKFFQLFPKQSLSLFMSCLEKPAASDLKKLCDKWKIKQDANPRYHGVHDRYVLIDNAMEVVITSGVDYLFDTSKECTLLVRQVSQ